MLYVVVPFSPMYVRAGAWWRPRSVYHSLYDYRLSRGTPTLIPGSLKGSHTGHVFDFQDP